MQTGVLRVKIPSPLRRISRLRHDWAFYSLVKINIPLDPSNTGQVNPGASLIWKDKTFRRFNSKIYRLVRILDTTF
jgi:hypothetical protein